MRFILLSFILYSCTHPRNSCNHYPKHWWAAIAKEELKSWEVSPSSVKCSDKKVIISKRNELGILSNFAETPFVLDGKRYESIEGFWQMLKFPESKTDERYDWFKELSYTRNQVAQMNGFDAKHAGDLASAIMAKHKINWVSYKNQKLEYATDAKGDHYQLIRRAMSAKLEQNQQVQKILNQTKGLELLPDHNQKRNHPAWLYHQIWMELRK